MKVRSEIVQVHVVSRLHFVVILHLFVLVGAEGLSRIGYDGFVVEGKAWEVIGLTCRGQ